MAVRARTVETARVLRYEGRRLWGGDRLGGLRLDVSACQLLASLRNPRLRLARARLRGRAARARSHGRGRSDARIRADGAAAGGRGWGGQHVPGDRPRDAAPIEPDG